MTIKFFPIFFLKQVGLPPIGTNFIFAGLPLSIAIVSTLASPISHAIGAFLCSCPIVRFSSSCLRFLQQIKMCQELDCTALFAFNRKVDAATGLSAHPQQLGLHWSVRARICRGEAMFTAYHVMIACRSCAHNPDFQNYRHHHAERDGFVSFPLDQAGNHHTTLHCARKHHQQRLPSAKKHPDGLCPKSKLHLLSCHM